MLSRDGDICRSDRRLGTNAPWRWGTTCCDSPVLRRRPDNSTIRSPHRRNPNRAQVRHGSGSRFHTRDYPNAHDNDALSCHSQTRLFVPRAQGGYVRCDTTRSAPDLISSAAPPPGTEERLLRTTLAQPIGRRTVRATYATIQGRRRASHRLQHRPIHGEDCTYSATPHNKSKSASDKEPGPRSGIRQPSRDPERTVAASSTESAHLRPVSRRKWRTYLAGRVLRRSVVFRPATSRSRCIGRAFQR